MKNIQTFTEFLNESNTISTGVIDHYKLNKKSVNDLKKYSFKLKDDYLKIKGITTGYDQLGKQYSYVIRALWNIKSNRTDKNYWPGDKFNISYGNKKGQLCIDNTISNVEIFKGEIYIPISETEVKKQIDKADGDLVKALIIFLDASFEKYGNEIETYLENL